MDRSTRFGIFLSLLGLAAGLVVLAAQELRIKFPPWVYVSLLVFAGLLVPAGVSLVTPLWASLTRLRKRHEPSEPELEVEDYIVLGQKIADSFGLAYKRVNAAHRDVADIYMRYAAQYIPLQRSPNPTTHVRVVVLMRDMAKEMNPIFDALDQAMPELRGISPMVAGGVRSLAEHYERDPSSASVAALRRHREEMSGLLKSVEHLREAAGAEFLRLVMKLSGEATIGATRRRGAKLVNAVMSTLDEIADSCRKAIKTGNRLLDGR